MCHQGLNLQYSKVICPGYESKGGGWVSESGGLSRVSGGRNESPYGPRKEQELWDVGRLFPMGILVPSSIVCEANYTPTLGFHEILLYPSKKLPSSTCVQGQGQKPGGPHARRAVAKRSYPMSKVRGSGQEYQTVTVQERPRGATLRRRSGVEPGRSYPTPPRPRPGVMAGRSNLMSKELWLRRCRRL